MTQRRDDGAAARRRPRPSPGTSALPGPAEPSPRLRAEARKEARAEARRYAEEHPDTRDGSWARLPDPDEGSRRRDDADHDDHDQRERGRPGRSGQRGRRGNPARGVIARQLHAQDKVLRRQEQQTRELVATASNAVVTAARVGRLLGRTGWRLARQLPGMAEVEQQAQRLRQALIGDFARLLDAPQHVIGVGSTDEQRTMALLQNAGSDPAPLRTAMTELLDRARDDDRTRGQDYLFGTIVSQLVPDEARILAALATGQRFAAVDVLAKQNNRTPSRNQLTNASTVGEVAKVSLPVNTGTYLTRLLGFGLISFADPEPGDGLDGQFDELEHDATVQDAREQASSIGKARVVRKTVSLTALGREFWAACAPEPRAAD